MSNRRMRTRPQENWTAPVRTVETANAGTPRGERLDAPTAHYFESGFGHDFSGVRVHTDEAAGRSALALGAAAYTTGRDIYFAPGHYAPRTPEGRVLLAHELAHVVQQGGSPGAPETARVDGPHSPREREASLAALAVTSGRRLPGSLSTGAGGMIQRSILGDVLGTIGGALVGAGVGFLIGGPIGAVVGGLLGGVAGLALGDALSADKRALTGPERTEAELVFGRSLDYGSVKLAEAPIMGIGENARTPFDTIYFPPGTFKLAFSDFMPWLIHELTHCWQYQHGISVFTKLFWALHGAKAYNYGGEAALRAAATSGKKFRDFNTEQQGDIMRDYYVKLKGGQDTSAYDPFVAEVKGLTLDSRVTTGTGAATATA